MLSRTKTECVECKFRDVMHEIGVEVRLDTRNIPRREIQVPWVIIQWSGDTDEDILHIILIDIVVWGRVLTNQKLSCSEDACCAAKDAKIRNHEDIQNKVGVTSVVDKMREVRLRWFGLVKRRCVDAPVKMCKMLVIESMMRDLGRPEKYWGELIRHDMTQHQVTNDMILDRSV
ncbi:hypothetical protein H5410_035958 [Solanum commersonii]|uniref:Reverse transcriptase n=1 Tax=Solanum commersonii TaxID=4109 RepID=A0A9J5Y6Q2_SOLCO|nr:hypothetical protein H5410_035958 [Solanum commersonii]